jgi:hypothetical protein
MDRRLIVLNLRLAAGLMVVVLLMVMMAFIWAAAYLR